MKLKLYLIPLSILFIYSCEKNDRSDIVNNVSMSTLKIRSFEEARYWAEQSISFIDGNTKSSTQHREIESWNAVTVPSTKGGSSQSDTLLYVFNFANEGGFSLISASTIMQPVIAVTESGSYVVEESTGNQAFDDYLDGVIDLLPRVEIPELYVWYGYEMEGDSCSRRVNVNWGQVGTDYYDEENCYQEKVYGKYCPNTIAGCAPVAIAQVMTYHKMPLSFTTTCSMGNDFASGSLIPLDWDQIVIHQQDHEDSLGCNAHHNYIAALLREIGERSNSDYSDSTRTGTATNRIKPAVESFGYHCSDEQNFSTSLAKTYIMNYGPLLICGKPDDSDFRHTWVADAYQDFRYSYCRYERAEGDGSVPVVTQRQIIDEAHMFHFNWGYNGNCNGWFALGVFDTSLALSYDNDGNTLARSYHNDMKMWTLY